MDPIGEWHLDLAAAALLVGAGVALVARRVGLAPATAAVPAALTLAAVAGQAPWWLVLAAMAATASARWASSRTIPVPEAVLGAAVVWSAVTTPTEAIVAVAVATLATGAAGLRLRARPTTWVPLAAAAASAVVWAAAPDTEPAIATGAALLAATAVSLLSRSDQSAVSTALPLLAVVWAAAAGFAGRPAGLVILGPLSALMIGPALMPPGTSPRWRPGAALMVSTVLALVAARTIGLRTTLTPTMLAVAIGLTAAAMTPWLVASCLNPSRDRDNGRMVDRRRQG